MSCLMAGYVDRTGAFVIPPTLRAAGAFEGGLARAVPYGTAAFGFLGPTGRWLLEPGLTFAGDRSEGVTTFNVGGHRDEDDDVVEGRWGWIGGGGVIAVPPTFEMVGRFREELIAVRERGLWGYAALDGTICIPPRFEYAGDFHEGLAVVTERGRDGYLGPDGAWVLPPRWEQAADFAGGLGRVLAAGRWAYVDRAGAARAGGFDRAGPHVGGMARVVHGGRLRLVGLEGQLLGDGPFDEIAVHADGLAPVRRGERWFLLDARGRLHGPYDRALPPTEGRARFVRSGQVGFLDAAGREVVAPRYDRARAFHEGRAAVRRDGRWTFVDADGREQGDPRWDDVGAFGDGLCPARAGTLWTLVDDGGEALFEPRFDLLEHPGDGLAAARGVRWPSAPSAPPQAWHVVPAGGLTHPVFHGCGADDELRAIACFRDDLRPDAMLRVEQILESWAELLAARAGGPVIPGGRPFLARHALGLRLTGVDDPVGAVELLLADLRDLGAPIGEAIFTRLRAPAGGGAPAPVPHPDDPRGPVEHEGFEALARRAFDPAQVPPRSESPRLLAAGRTVPGGAVVLETRGPSLHLPGVRICYGVTQEGFVEEDADERTSQVAAVVTAALRERLDPARIWLPPRGRAGWLAPAPMTRDGDDGVERVAALGRTGYCFSVECEPLLMDVAPELFRYREPELMEALAAAVRRLDLEPVILWERFGRPLPGAAEGVVEPTAYVVNLWERAARPG